MGPLQNAYNRHTGEGDCVIITFLSFRVALRLHGMTKLLVLCSYAKLSH